MTYWRCRRSNPLPHQGPAGPNPHPSQSRPGTGERLARSDPPNIAASFQDKKRSLVRGIHSPPRGPIAAQIVAPTKVPRDGPFLGTSATLIISLLRQSHPLIKRNETASPFESVLNLTDRSCIVLYFAIYDFIFTNFIFLFRISSLYIASYIVYIWFIYEFIYKSLYKFLDKNISSYTSPYMSQNI